MAKALPMLLAILSMLVGAAASLVMVVFVMAAAANTKPEEWPKIRAMMIGTGAIGVVCVGVAVALLYLGHPYWSSIVGAAPVVIYIAILIVASLR